MNGALGVLEIGVAADDHDMNIGMQRARLKRQRDAVHAGHADVGQEQIDGALTKKGDGGFAALAAFGHAEVLGIFLNDRLQKAKRRRFIVYQKDAIHRCPPCFAEASA